MNRFDRRTGFLATVLTWAFLSSAAAHGADRFVSGTEDLPLMPGLLEAPDAAMVFDTPSGRIVETYASGHVTGGQVLAFYAETLPQLGWRPMGNGMFRREDEILRLEIDKTNKPSIVVRFALSPARSSGGG